MPLHCHSQLLPPHRQRHALLVLAALCAIAAAVLGPGSAALAQQDEVTSVPVESLPEGSLETDLVYIEGVPVERVPASESDDLTSADGNEWGPLADRRSIEVVNLDCASKLGRERLTLFANGTVRLRRDPPSTTGVNLTTGLGVEPVVVETEVYLGEMGPDELDIYLDRLRVIDLSKVREEGLGAGVRGDWVERCELLMEFPRYLPRRFEFGRRDTLPLDLSRVVHIVEELEDRVIQHKVERSGLPANYEPEIGDQLRRRDGNIFEIRARTVDGRGFEMRGLQQPMTLYVDAGDLAGEFPILVSRRDDMRRGR